MELERDRSRRPCLIYRGASFCRLLDRSHLGLGLGHKCLTDQPSTVQSGDCSFSLLALSLSAVLLPRVPGMGAGTKLRPASVGIRNVEVLRASGQVETGLSVSDGMASEARKLGCRTEEDFSRTEDSRRTRHGVSNVSAVYRALLVVS